LIGRGSQNFTFDTLPDAKGFPIARNTDVEYKVLDHLADQLGNNVNASGKVTIVIDNPRVCGSCESVISQFEARYKNIKVEVIKKPKPPIAGTLPPKGR
jgi:filamentous hemagglutinin